MITFPAWQLVPTMTWKKSVPRACKLEGLPGWRIRAQSSKGQGKVVFEEVLMFCTNFPGLVVVLESPGARLETL